MPNDDEIRANYVAAVDRAGVQNLPHNGNEGSHSECDPYADVPPPDEPGEIVPEPPDPDPGVKDDANPPTPVHPSPPDHSGQVRIAYRLAAGYEHRLLYVHGIGWHYWDGTRWAIDDAGVAKRAVLSVLRAALAESLADMSLRTDVQKCESHNGIHGVLGIAEALEPFAATIGSIDADPYLVNVANGTLDLRTLQLRGHDPADRITKVTRAAWRPDSTGTTWTGHLQRVLPDDAVRAYLQRLAGLALLGRVNEHVLPILTGTGGNGKGVFYKALLWALGDYAAPAEPDLFMARDGAHPTGQMDLFGRRLVVVSESDEGRRLAEATMKRLTGGDTIKARLMRRDFVQFEPSHLAMLITNHLPKVSGDDPAVWRRIRVIPFDVSIPDAEQDETLDEKLALEADAILSWAVAGWSDYHAHGLAEPDAVKVATGAYQAASDAVGRFIAECCVTTSPALKATTGQLFDAWDKWRGRDGAEQISQKAFADALDRRGWPVTSRTGAGRWRSGIALLAVEDDNQ